MPKWLWGTSFISVSMASILDTAKMLAMIPPALVVLSMQRWFVKGLVDSEK